MVNNVGRIKTKKVKRTTQKLYAQMQDEITTDFEQNKEKINKKFSINSKKLRNVISGYCTRLKKSEL